MKIFFPLTVGLQCLTVVIGAVRLSTPKAPKLPSRLGGRLALVSTRRLGNLTIGPPSNDTESNISDSSTVEHIILQFSVWREEKFEVDDFSPGQEPDVVQALLDAVLEILCLDTDFLVANSSDLSSDYCEDLRTYVGDSEFASFLSVEAELKVAEIHSGELQWAQCNISFPVLQVGQVYLQTALQNMDSDSDPKDFQREGVRLMEIAANGALYSSIEEGRFDTLVGHQIKSSEPGKEEATFNTEAQQSGQEPVEEGEFESYEQEEVDPAPMHSMRIVGIIMFIANLGTFFLLLRLASRRKHHLEMKQNQVGGLSTEDGVECILQVGRQKPQVSVAESEATGPEQAPGQGRLRVSSSSGAPPLHSSSGSTSAEGSP